MRRHGLVPSQASSPSVATALRGVDSVVSMGTLSGMKSGGGPHRFSDNHMNPVIKHNIQVADLMISGLSVDQTQMYEHSIVFAIKMSSRPDFHNGSESRVVALPHWQVNVFLKEMHLLALQEYKKETGKTTTDELSERNIARLILKNPRLEILKFLSARMMFDTIVFLGIQYGNRFLNKTGGPGIAVVTGGTSYVRNTCANADVKEQDEFWLVLRTREPRGALAFFLETYSCRGGPRLADRHFIDLAGLSYWGPAHKVGHVADKTSLDLASVNAKLLAEGLSGTALETQFAERNAPTVRVVLCTTGIKMHQT